MSGGPPLHPRRNTPGCSPGPFEGTLPPNHVNRAAYSIRSNQKKIVPRWIYYQYPPSPFDEDIRYPKFDQHFDLRNKYPVICPDFGYFFWLILLCRPRIGLKRWRPLHGFVISMLPYFRNSFPGWKHRDATESAFRCY